MALFLTRTDEINSYRPDYNNQSFTNFRKEIAHNIATGKIKALSFSDLGKVEIRIFGGFVKLWDDIKLTSS